MDLGSGRMALLEVQLFVILYLCSSQACMCSLMIFGVELRCVAGVRWRVYGVFLEDL